MPPPADIVKVAIEWPGAYPKLMEIDQKKPLSAIIKEVCDGWSLANHEYFALQHADSSNFYITEKNRNEIKNGTILRLTTSPAQNAQQLHERIQSSSMDAKLEALKDLASLSRDVTFAQEFINLDGISLLTQMVESGTDRYQKLQKIMKPCFGDMLSFTLTAFVELMDHGIVSWDTFSVAFIKKIASFVNKSAIDISILQRSLAILESMVLNSHDLYQKVAQEITIGQLIPHLQGTDQEIQTYTIAVINALFLKAPDERRQEMANILAQKQLRYIILTHVIRAQRAINNEMAHQLYVLQVLTFNLLEDRMMTKMDPQDQAQRDIIFELRRIAFDAESEPNNSSGSMEKRKSMYTRDYKKLGFIKAIWGHLENSQALNKLFPHILGNVGFVFTKEDLTEIRDVLLANKGSPLKSPGHIEILSDEQLIETGDKVGASEATLLIILNTSPFSFGHIIQQVLDNGSIYNPEVLDITEQTLHSRLREGDLNVASVCLQIGYLTVAQCDTLSSNHVNPAMDFTQTPPGMLALDNMLYFAKHHQDAYIRIVLENSSREDKHECPFGRSSIELTKMLCEILKVGELPSETCNDFHPMFFTHDRAFEEFFCICIQLLNKTWKEMRATSEDFNKQSKGHMSPTALGEAVFLQLGEVADADMEPSRHILKEQPLNFWARHTD
ncbi:Engulfment and cell motility protein 1 [Lemmus lemmus]